MALQPGDRVVVETDQSLDSGTVEEVAASMGADERRPGSVIRRVDAADDLRLAANQQQADTLLALFTARARATDLWLKPLAAHHSFGRDRLAILFGSEDEIDLRRLAALLQPDYTGRVEFRQVGVRDEAAHIGGIGPCGRVFCCCSWQKAFRAVNVRMAKMQELSLNPAAINGSCGRLKCCLRFEYGQYCEASASQPAFGTAVTWPEGQGTVTGRDVLNGILVVRTSEGHYVRLPASAVTAVPPPSGPDAATPTNASKGAADEDPGC
jgi:cell fate regulator YaaT (PSP1 superfamily)